VLRPGMAAPPRPLGEVPWELAARGEARGSLNLPFDSPFSGLREPPASWASLGGAATANGAATAAGAPDDGAAVVEGETEEGAEATAVELEAAEAADAADAAEAMVALPPEAAAEAVELVAAVGALAPGSGIVTYT